MIAYEECPFCMLIEDGTSPCWQILFGSRPGKEIIWTGRSSSVVLDTAPVTRGHVVIIPNGHVSSLGKVNAEARSEIMVLKGHVSDMLESLYNAPTILEHGAESFSRNAGACVDHAHLHLIPGWFGLLERLRADFPSTQIFDDHETALVQLRGSPYILCEEPDGTVYGVMAPICQTQYLRRLAAQAAGRGERWNWRDCIRLARTLGIADDVRAASVEIGRFVARHANNWGG